MSTSKVWVFDLDGTLANTAHRDHLRPESNGNGDEWVPYSMQCAGDSVIVPVRELILGGAWNVIWIVTGRTELARELTEAWLHSHFIDYDELIMRADGDHRNNVTLKLEALDRIEALGYEVTLWVDDYPRVIEAMAERGIPTMLYSGSRHA